MTSSTTVSTISSSISPSTTTIMNSTLGANTIPQSPPAPNGECELLGPFAILVQGALGGLALLSLVYKRWRERPQRPLKIWAFDVSKQVFGTLLLHLANLVMSMFSAGQIEQQVAKAVAQTVDAAPDDDWKPNPCSFYLLNLGIDTTVGIVILLLILKVLHAAANKTPLANPPESIKSGHYGDPPRASWWLKQSLIYFMGLLGMKICVFFIFLLCPWIVTVGDWALKWTEGNTALQIAFVMLIFPLIMNAFQYYVIDTFIKKRPDAEGMASGHVRTESNGETGGLLAEHDDDDHHNHRDSMDDEEAYKPVLHASSAEIASSARGIYKLGDESDLRSGTEGSSSSTMVTERDRSRDRALQK